MSLAARLRWSSRGASFPDSLRGMEESIDGSGITGVP
jgi:hypothetical protein